MTRVILSPRKRLRLVDYNYAQAGMYYVTLCTQWRTHLFGEVLEDRMVLNAAGQMVKSLWETLPNHYPAITLDAFVIMPNHIHGIIFIVGDALVASLNKTTTGVIGENKKPLIVTPQGRPLPVIMDRFKSSTTVHYIHGVRKEGWTPFDRKLWQRSYYDRIIRTDDELTMVRDYIALNPAK
jgi:putative transposase